MVQDPAGTKERIFTVACSRPSIPGQLAAAGEAADGFLPPAEAKALFVAACSVVHLGPLLEIGTYCGKSAIYLAAAVRQVLPDATGRVITVDHHRGSEEHQPGWEWHDPTLWDADAGLVDTLGRFRRTIHRAGVAEDVIAIVGRSVDVAAFWAKPLGMVFIDGGHTEEAAQSDYQSWAPHVVAGGLLAIHDVFSDPAQGGQAPYHAYRRAVDSGAFAEESGMGSLKLLRRLEVGTPV